MFGRLTLLLLFAAGAMGGVVFQPRIAARVKQCIPDPDPNANRTVLYWTSPMDPSVGSDRPGKRPMGMDLVPVYAGEQVAEVATVVAAEIQERAYTKVDVESGPLVRSLETVGTVSFAEPLLAMSR